MRKKDLIKKIEELEKIKNDCWDSVIKKNDTILKLKSENQNLNLKYMTLLARYNKLLKSTLEAETKNITYNGKLYGIIEVNHYQKVGEVESIVITAHNIPEKDGLVNSMGKVFKEAYDSINETLFGNKK